MGALLSSFVVMCITTPRTPKEWAVGLISTVICSIGGGATLIRWMGWQDWAHDPVGLVAMLGVAFACGLPGWAVVRWIFYAIRKREGQSIDEIWKELRK